MSELQRRYYRAILTHNYEVRECGNPRMQDIYIYVCVYICVYVYTH